MNDSFSGKNGKVKVMYVRSDDRSDKNDKSDNKKRGSSSDRQRKAPGSDSRAAKRAPRSQAAGATKEREAHWGDSGRPPRSIRNEHEKPPRSAWQARLQDVSEPEAEIEPFDHGGISGKSQIDPAQLRRQREEETKVYGENACQALFSSRPDALVRAYFLQEVTPRFREALRWMASNRKAYHVVDEEEMARVSGTEHHGGVCFLIKKRTGLSVGEYLESAAKRDCIIAVENVGNPHNLGGIMRSAAHFGVNAIVVRDASLVESGAAIRTAEGGAEHLKAITADDLAAGLDTFHRAGYRIIAIAPGKGTPFNQIELPEKVVLVVSDERGGLPDYIRELVDLHIAIDGARQIGGLNLSVATGVLLAEWWKQNHRA